MLLYYCIKGQPMKLLELFLSDILLTWIYMGSFTPLSKLGCQSPEEGRRIDQKNLRYVENLCWDHLLKIQIYYIYQHRWTFIQIIKTCWYFLFVEQITSDFEHGNHWPCFPTWLGWWRANELSFLSLSWETWHQSTWLGQQAVILEERHHGTMSTWETWCDRLWKSAWDVQEKGETTTGCK